MLMGVALGGGTSTLTMPFNRLTFETLYFPSNLRVFYIRDRMIARTSCTGESSVNKIAIYSTSFEALEM